MESDIGSDGFTCLGAGSALAGACAPRLPAAGGWSTPAGGEDGYGVVAVAGDADGLGLRVGRDIERLAAGMHRCHRGVRPLITHVWPTPSVR
jgi:hypothetical protein